MVRWIPKIVKTLSTYLAPLDKIIWNVHIWLFLTQKRGRCSKRNLRVLLSKICRCLVWGFHRIFDQNLYISTFFDKKSVWNVHIWLFLAQKRGRCSKRDLRVSLSKICRCVVVGFHQIFDQNLYISTFFDKKSGPWSPGKTKVSLHKNYLSRLFFWGEALFLPKARWPLFLSKKAKM